MKKLLKFLVGAVIAVVALVLLLVVTLPFTINPLVKTAASVGGPKLLGVPVSVGKVALHPFSGQLTISQLAVGNPQGYSDRQAFAVDKVDVLLSLRSLVGGDTIVIKKIQIDAPNISYESKGGQSNFDAMQANVKKAGHEAKTENQVSEAVGEKKPSKKVIIEHFELNGAKVSCSAAWTLGRAVTLPLPSVVLNDIGKESGGTSPTEAFMQIVNQVVGGLSSAITSAASGAGDLLKSGGDAAGNAAGSLKNAAGGAVDAASDAAKSLKKLFK